MTAATGVLKFYSTSIGKKVVMAVTGFMMFFFVCVHMVGNLQIYAGPDKLNAYAHFLQSTKSLLWSFRSVMFVCAALHILTAVLLTLQNWRSRPVRYTEYTANESSFFSRNMIWTGLLMGFFVVYHLMHFTIGNLHPSFVAVEVHRNVVLGFSDGWVAAFYIISMAILGMHMGHGVFGMFQSLGLAHPKYNQYRRYFSTGITLLIVAANISMPLAIYVTNNHPLILQTIGVK